MSELTSSCEEEEYTSSLVVFFCLDHEGGLAHIVHICGFIVSAYPAQCEVVVNGELWESALLLLITTTCWILKTDTLNLRLTLCYTWLGHLMLFSTYYKARQK